MRTEGMSPQSWRQVKSEIQKSTSEFRGRKILYVKPGEIEWFESEDKAVQSGFKPAQLSDIRLLAAQQLKGEDLKGLETEFSSLIEVRKGQNLLANPQTTPDALHLHGMLMAVKGKKLENAAYIDLGRRCLESAALKFLQAGNTAKANTCKKLLVRNVEFMKQHPLYDLRALASVEKTNATVAKGVFVPKLNGGSWWKTRGRDWGA